MSPSARMYYFGRKPAHREEDAPRLKLKPFLALPAPPEKSDWYSEVGDWPMFMNDRIGDCTIAMTAHIEEAASRYGYGATAQFSDDDVLDMYERVSGYDPADPSTDQGAVLQDVYNDWRKNGIAGHKATVFAQVDHKDLREVRNVNYLFGSVGLGIVVTQDMMDDFQHYLVWSRSTGEQLGGHAVPIVGYDKQFVYVVTWGRVQPMTWDCYRAVTEEAWVAVLPDWFDVTGKDPLGVNLQGLGAAFAELTGQPNPFPDPNPQPTPEPDWQKLFKDFAGVVQTAWQDIEGGWAIVKDWIEKHKEHL